MKTLRTALIILFGLVSLARAKAFVVEGKIIKQGESYLVSYRHSNKPVSIEDFVTYLQGIRNGSVVGLSIISAESIPIPTIQTILTGASKNPLIELLDIRVSIAGKLELERREKPKKAEQAAPLNGP